jgi:hypothetical protein
VYPFITQLEEDDEIDKAYFQQDGATVHSAHMSMALFDDMFAGRIIPTITWPPRSPDLSPPDFFLVRRKTQCIRTISTQQMI